MTLFRCSECKVINADVEPCFLFVDDNTVEKPDTCPYEKLHSTNIAKEGKGGKTVPVWTVVS